MKTLKDIAVIVRDSPGEEYGLVDPLHLCRAAEEWLREAELTDLPGVSWSNHDEAIGFNMGVAWFIRSFFFPDSFLEEKPVSKNGVDDSG